MATVALTAANISKWLFWGRGIVSQMWGMNNQGTTLYIQLHEVPPLANGTLPNGTVPSKKSFQVLANAPFAFTIPVELSECFLVISTTEANYTAVAASGGLDMSVACSSEFMCDGTEVVVGDLTTARATLQAWAEASGPQLLLRLTLIEQLGAARFVAIQACDTFQGGLYLPGKILKILANQTLDLFFGRGGEMIFSQDQNTGTYRKGCSIQEVDALGIATQSANSIVARAIYKPNF